MLDRWLGGAQSSCNIDPRVCSILPRQSLVLYPRYPSNSHPPPVFGERHQSGCPAVRMPRPRCQAFPALHAQTCDLRSREVQRRTRVKFLLVLTGPEQSAPATGSSTACSLRGTSCRAKCVTVGLKSGETQEASGVRRLFVALLLQSVSILGVELSRVRRLPRGYRTLGSGCVCLGLKSEISSLSTRPLSPPLPSVVCTICRGSQPSLSQGMEASSAVVPSCACVDCVCLLYP